jgi:hypothetical protein
LVVADGYSDDARLGVGIEVCGIEQLVALNLGELDKFAAAGPTVP